MLRHVVLGFCLVVFGLVGRAEAQLTFSTPFVIHGPAFDEKTDGNIIDTPSNVPAVIYSIPVDIDHVCYIEAFVTAVDMANGQINAGAATTIAGICGRSTGNVAVLTTQTSGAISTFVAPQPGIALVANPVTQTIDVQVTGRLNQLLRWSLSIKIRMSV